MSGRAEDILNDGWPPGFFPPLRSRLVDLIDRQFIAGARAFVLDQEHEREAVEVAVEAGEVSARSATLAPSDPPFHLEIVELEWRAARAAREAAREATRRAAHRSAREAAREAARRAREATQEAARLERASRAACQPRPQTPRTLAAPPSRKDPLSARFVFQDAAWPAETDPDDLIWAA